MAHRQKAISSTVTEPFQAFNVQAQLPLLLSPHLSQAYAAQNQPLQRSFCYNSNCGHGNNRFNNNHGNRANRNFHGNNRGNKYNYGFNKSNYQGFFSQCSCGSRIHCQICGFTSHEAIDCYDRMSPDIFGKVHPTKLAAVYTHYASKPPPS